MPTTYTGDPTNFPASITIPSDGDAPIKAADVNVAFEAIEDQIASLNYYRTINLARIDIPSGAYTIFATNAFVSEPNTMAVGGLKAGDILLIDTTLHYILTNTGGQQTWELRMSVIEDFGGTNVLHAVPGCAAIGLTSDQAEGNITLTGMWTIVLTGNGIARIALQGNAGGATSSNIAVTDRYSSRVVVLRPAP